MTVQVWDAQIGGCALGLLEDHADGVYSVSFSPDGKRMDSGFADKTIRVWDVQTDTAMKDKG